MDLPRLSPVDGRLGGAGGSSSGSRYRRRPVEWVDTGVPARHAAEFLHRGQIRSPAQVLANAALQRRHRRSRAT